tara:strand:+ start:199 stop:465 length:267 start_codon:yes stop_codon:yes gene_type:complete
MNAKALGLSQTAIAILIGLAITIFILISIALIAGQDSPGAIGACMAGPIITLRGYAYTRTGETRKGYAQMAAGTAILVVLAARIAGYL